MMPSRGLHLARGHAPRVFQLHCRNLSSTSRQIPTRLVRANPTISPRSIKWHGARTALPSFAISVRHASTTPQRAADSTEPVSTEAASSIPPADQNTFPNLDTISLEGIDLNAISDVPERIGYLSEIGINYGYGITSSLQYVIEHIHVSAGLPWWGSVAATAVILRIALLPLFLKSSDIMARSQALNPVLQPITNRMKAAQKAGDQVAMMSAWNELGAARKRAGISISGQFTPILAQGIIAYCGFRLVRAMATLPVPALKTEGPLWLQDLTLSDPYLILPIAMAGTIHLLVRMGGETGAAGTSEMAPGIQKFMLYGVPTLIVFTMGWMPALTCIWFTSGGAIGIVQSQLLQRPAIRNFFGLTPLYKNKNAPKLDSNTIDVKLGKKPSTAASDQLDFSTPAATPQAGRAQRKNQAYMQPRYQSPKLNYAQSPARPGGPGSVIDVQSSAGTQPAQPSPAPAAAAAPDSDMIQPSQKPGSVLEQASKAFNEGRKRRRQSARKSGD